MIILKKLFCLNNWAYSNNRRTGLFPSPDQYILPDGKLHPFKQSTKNQTASKVKYLKIQMKK